MHPNDHVNASQSSNDVFPSAIHLAATEAIAVDLLPALEHLEDALRRKQREFAEVVKSGRTHLMDATPVTLGQEFGGYASQIHQASTGSTTRCPASASCRSAAPPSARASTRRRRSPRGDRPAGRAHRRCR